MTKVSYTIRPGIGGILIETKLHTSWKLHNSTLPGSARPFSHAKALVRSRHLASTIFPFFSLLTCRMAPNTIVEFFSSSGPPRRLKQDTHVGMQTQVPPTRQPQPSEPFVLGAHLFSIHHQTFQLCQSLFNLGYGSGAIDEFPVPSVKLWMRGGGSAVSRRDELRETRRGGQYGPVGTKRSDSGGKRSSPSRKAFPGHNDPEPPNIAFRSVKVFLADPGWWSLTPASRVFFRSLMYWYCSAKLRH